jgi:acyl-coenzyme A synthetase/AMP-(fatty) acid ligase
MLPQVASAAAVLATAPGRPRALRAAVVLKDLGYAFDEDRARGALGRVLPEVSVPVSIIAVERMPRTPSGKLDRDSVAKMIEISL